MPSTSTTSPRKPTAAKGRSTRSPKAPAKPRSMRHTAPAVAETVSPTPPVETGTPVEISTPAAAPGRGLSGLDAAVQVLREAGEPLRCSSMVERMLAQGLWSTGGKTPAATINAAIIREIRHRGEQARFRKTGRGLFELAL